MGAGRIGRYGKSRIPTRLPGIEPLPVIVIAEKHMDIGVIGLSIGKGQQGAVD